jgi:hypothetical protein
MFEFAAAMFIIAIGVVFAIVVLSMREGTPAVERKFGRVDSAAVCPHCGAAGHVRSREIHQKQGISNAKAVAAVLTAGLSFLAVGIFRMVTVTQAHCTSCTTTWIP